jgi:hypothetical protein
MPTPQSLAGVLTGVIDPRSVVYRGVRMRSRLEADFAYHLDRLETPWAYEPLLFETDGRAYLPDFQIVRDGRPCFIEVKPTLDKVPRAKQRMEFIWRAIPDAVLLVVCAEGSTFFAATRDESWRSWSERWVHQ